jgi:hypothetical protein
MLVAWLKVSDTLEDMLLVNHPWAVWEGPAHHVTQSKLICPFSS